MRPIEVHPSDAARAWEHFPGGPMQRILHNEMFKRLEEKRNRLEKSSEQELKVLQGEISELRQLLGLIHSKDSTTLKELYG